MKKIKIFELVYDRRNLILLQIIQYLVFPFWTSYAAERAMTLNLRSSGSRSLNFLKTSMASLNKVASLVSPWLIGNGFHPSNS